MSTTSRGHIDNSYFEGMSRAKIIVTVNPANWEGDFRLWESLSSGALVLVDRLYVPHPHPLIDGEHVVYYNNSDQTDLWSKLDYYRANPDEAHRIAVNGYLFAMKYHRTVNFADYVLRSAHLQIVRNSMKTLYKMSSPAVQASLEEERATVRGYTETAHSLLKLARNYMREKRLREKGSTTHKMWVNKQVEIISTEDLQTMQIEYKHAHHSPRNGSDISVQHQNAILTCPNQAKCVIPELQLKKKFKVYLCKNPSTGGKRFYFLSREAFLLHPNAEIGRKADR